MQDISEINLKGKHVVMNAKAFAKALSTIERIFHCESGFGLDPENSGTKIYGHFVAGAAEADIEECYVRRYDVERLATEEEAQQATTVNQAREALGKKNTELVNSAYEGAPGMDELEHPLGEHVRHIVAWVSRHPALPAQINTLAEKLGSNIRVVEVTNTYHNYKAVIDTVKRLGATHAVLVLPLSMIALILDSREGQGIVWLRAEMDSAHTGKCIDGYKEVANDRHNSVVQVQHQCSMFDPNTDVLMPGETTRHLRFREFQVLKSIDLVTEPFTGGE